MCILSDIRESKKYVTNQVFQLIAYLFFSLASVHSSFSSSFLKGGLFTFTLIAFPLRGNRKELTDEELHTRNNGTAGVHFQKHSQK